jgi:serine protease
VAFTNMPYVTDAGSSCGMSFVNSGAAGALDGVTIVGGHEYAETITDQFPNGGWLDSSLNENGDKCSWISSGQGASQNIALTTGNFAVQSTWANDFNSGSGGCLISHAIVGAPNIVTVTNPGSQTSTVGTSASVQIGASDSGNAALTFSATGLPAGLTIAPVTGLISGTPTTAASSSVTVTATDTTSVTASTTFTWTVNPSVTCTAGQLLGNPGFETGTPAPWKATPGVVAAAGTEPAHTGNWMARFVGNGVAKLDNVRQAVTLPAGCASYTLSFWRHIDTTRGTTTVFDTLRVQVLNAAGTLLQTLVVYSNRNAGPGFVKASFSLAAYAGQTITVKFLSKDAGGATTSNFVVDDTAVNVA